MDPNMFLSLPKEVQDAITQERRKLEIQIAAEATKRLEAENTAAAEAKKRLEAENVAAAEAKKRSEAENVAAAEATKRLEAENATAVMREQVEHLQQRIAQTGREKNRLMHQQFLLMQRTATFCRKAVSFSSMGNSISKFMRDLADVSANIFAGRPQHASSLRQTLESMKAPLTLQDALVGLQERCENQVHLSTECSQFLVRDSECALRAMDGGPFLLVQQRCVEFWSQMDNLGLVVQGLHWLHSLKTNCMREGDAADGTAVDDNYLFNKIQQLLVAKLGNGDGFSGSEMIATLRNQVMRSFSCGGGQSPLKIPDEALRSGVPAPAGATDLLLCWSQVSRQEQFPSGRPVSEVDIVQANTTDSLPLVLNAVGTLEWKLESRTKSRHDGLEQALAECVAAACQVDAPSPVIPISAVGALIDRNEFTWILVTRTLGTAAPWDTNAVPATGEPSVAAEGLCSVDDGDDASSLAGGSDGVDRVLHTVRYIRQTFVRAGGDVASVIGPLVLIFSLSFLEAWYRQLILSSDLDLLTHEDMVNTDVANGTNVSTSTERDSAASENGPRTARPPPSKKRKLDQSEHDHTSKGPTVSHLHLSPPRTIGEVLDACPSAFFRGGVVAPRIQEWLRETRTVLNAHADAQAAGIAANPDSTET
jgi:hypothetical protein